MHRSTVGATCMLCLSVLACHDGAASTPEPTASAVEPSTPPSTGVANAAPGLPPAVLEARQDSEVRSDEVVVLFPALAHRTEEGDWRANLHGWIYEPEEHGLVRLALIEKLRQTLQISAIDSESIHFRERSAMLLVDNESGKRIAVRIGDSVHQLAASGENGHFWGEVPITGSPALRLEAGGILQVEALLPPDDERRFVGRVHLVGPKGVLLISDIDDTIKISHVRDRAELMRRTFLLDFEAVADLAPVYRRWLGDSDHLHFVSSSPWQLYGELAEMADGAHFPLATYSLKNVRLKDASLLSLLADPEQTKPLEIEPLLQRYPERQVILVGDSGEKDPEVYGALYRKYPKRVKRIVIRDVTQEPRDGPRYQKAFQDVPAAQWQLFRDPKELL